MIGSLKRRDFLALLGGAAATWPVVARAQQFKRVGVLMGYDEKDPEAKSYLFGFAQKLADLGWTEGRNLWMDIRWNAADVNQIRILARQLVDLKPDVILANSTSVTAALQRETRTIPIVFVIVSDPVGQGFVAGLPRPGGNITGFSHTEASLGGKWLELLTEIAPGLKRVAAMFNPDTAPYVSSYFLPSFEAAAWSLKVQPIMAPVHNDAEIEQVITSLGREPGSGFVAMPDNFIGVNRALIASHAARNNVPAVYQSPMSARDGGLLAYGVDYQEIFRGAALYVDRILRGARAEELPVQMPTKFVMVLNAKAAKALGLVVPPSILLRADEVIE